MIFPNPRSRALAGASFLLLVSAHAPALEDAPGFTVAEIVAPELKQSPHHSVEQVEVDGRFLRYRIDTEFGAYNAGSTPLLRIRVEETAILSQAVNQFARQDSDIGEELRGQLSVSADSAIDILARPVSTATDLAGQLADNLNETLTGSRNVTPEPGTGAPDIGDSSDPVIGVHRRNVAAQWGLDVYSSNPRVQEFLNTVARARSAGRISAGAPSFINTGLKRIAMADPEIDAMAAGELKTLAAQDLAVADAAILASLQIGVELINRFLSQPAFTPRHRSRITHYLQALDGVLNRSAFLEAALVAENENTALAFEQAAMMLHYYHRRIGRLEKLYAGENVLQAISADGKVIHVFPVDVIYWSEHTQELFDALEKRAARAGFSAWEVVTAGAITPHARAELGQRGFALREIKNQ